MDLITLQSALLESDLYYLDFGMEVTMRNQDVLSILSCLSCVMVLMLWNRVQCLKCLLGCQDADFTGWKQSYNGLRCVIETIKGYLHHGIPSFFFFRNLFVCACETLFVRLSIFVFRYLPCPCFITANDTHEGAGCAHCALFALRKLCSTLYLDT